MQCLQPMKSCANQTSHGSNHEAAIQKNHADVAIQPRSPRRDQQYHDASLACRCINDLNSQLQNAAFARRHGILSTHAGLCGVRVWACVYFRAHMCKYKRIRRKIVQQVPLENKPKGYHVNTVPFGYLSSCSSSLGYFL